MIITPAMAQEIIFLRWRRRRLDYDRATWLMELAMTWGGESDVLGGGSARALC